MIASIIFYSVVSLIFMLILGLYRTTLLEHFSGRSFSMNMGEEIIFWLLVLLAGILWPLPIFYGIFHLITGRGKSLL